MRAFILLLLLFAFTSNVSAEASFLFDLEGNYYIDGSACEFESFFHNEEATIVNNDDSITLTIPGITARQKAEISYSFYPGVGCDSETNWEGGIIPMPVTKRTDWTTIEADESSCTIGYEGVSLFVSEQYRARISNGENGVITLTVDGFTVCTMTPSD